MHSHGMSSKNTKNSSFWPRKIPYFFPKKLSLVFFELEEYYFHAIRSEFRQEFNESIISTRFKLDECYIDLSPIRW